WKTVASTAVYMAGNAVVEAAEDVKRQLKNNASYKLRCKPEDLEVGESRVYLKSDPQKHVNVQSVVRGYKYNNGNTAGNMVIGDRKSTRLNSSHVSISYAVFCLKK